MPRKETETRHQRQSHLEWVPITRCRVSSETQRVYRPGHADAMAANFELESFGFPAVSKRGDGCYYVIDGQHRIAAAKIFGFDSDDDVFQMEVYEGLSEADEAELFLDRNATRSVSAWDKFHKALTAGRPEELAIEQIVRWHGLSVGPYRTPEQISAVNTLRKVYRRVGSEGLGRVLRIVSEAYGDGGLDGPVIEGTGLFVGRYNGNADDTRLTQQLSKARGGVGGLITDARKLRASIGQPLPQCIAASEVTYYNRATGAKKLPAWWREEQ